MKYLRIAAVAIVAFGVTVAVRCNILGNAKAKWTVIAYYDGNTGLDNGENGKSLVISEARQAENVGSTDQVQFVAMVAALKTGGQCTYYHIEKHVNGPPDSISSTVLKKLGPKDMSNPTTLNDFIAYARQKYPAEHYMLMLKDHGGGWRGALRDVQNGDGKLMTLPQIGQALDTFHFDLISFDAPLMGMVEVGYELRRKADYMTASQFATYPGTFGTAEWLGYLVANPNASGLDLAKEVVKATEDADKAKQVSGQMAVIDLSQMGALASDIAVLGSNLDTASVNYGPDVLDDVGEVQSTQLDEPAFADLREFCVAIMQDLDLQANLPNFDELVNSANAVISDINNAVPLTATNTETPPGGLCIHFPSTTAEFDSADYVKCQFQSFNWPTFLSAYIQAVGGGAQEGISVASTPAGAEIFLDGADQYCVTPATINNVPAGEHTIGLTLIGYQNWSGNVQVTAGQTAQVNATLQPGNNFTAMLNGTVSWTGHDMYNCYVILDTVHGSQYAMYMNMYVSVTPQRPDSGSFSMNVPLGADTNFILTAWNDANGDGLIDAGDGWGWWDIDGHGGSIPDAGDIFTLAPNQTISNIPIALATWTGYKDFKLHDPHPIAWDNR
jgi:hypothetical protein